MHQATSPYTDLDSITIWAGDKLVVSIKLLSCLEMCNHHTNHLMSKTTNRISFLGFIYQYNPQVNFTNRGFSIDLIKYIYRQKIWIPFLWCWEELYLFMRLINAAVGKWTVSQMTLSFSDANIALQNRNGQAWKRFGAIIWRWDSVFILVPMINIII